MFDSANLSLSHTPVVSLLGAKLHALTEAQCVQLVMTQLAQQRGGWLVTINLDHLRRLVNDPTYTALCAKATLVVADGMPLVWASRLQGTPLPQRVTGSDLIWQLTARAAVENRSIYLLGGTPTALSATALILQQRYPGLRLVGTFCPNFGFEHRPGEMNQLTTAVAAARPDIIYVALGSPKQERVIEQLRADLPGAWWMGVGISFSFVSGEIKRSPVWLQQLGLEWLYRLIQEPQRLFKRYLLLGLPFALTLFWHALGYRLGLRK